MTLGDTFESLMLQGGSALTATGNAANNQLIGNYLANTLDGGAGADTMEGYGGADLFIVDNVDDVCIDDDSDIETVHATVSYTLRYYGVDNLVLIGPAAINGTGNSGDNDITGNAADNLLDGMGGIDVLRGGAGNDLYRVATTTSQVIELANEGIDTVESTATFTLGTAVEHLTLTGTGNINGTGNGLDNIILGNAGNNTLTGNAGNDRLAGGGGRDAMYGGLGDDTYVVGQSNDAANENSNEGTDTVESSITLTLGTNLENLTLLGTGVINGIGNTSANVIRGNSVANTLTGNGGSDTLIGGDGADIYSFSTGHGSDTIDNFSADTAQDRLNFTNMTRSQVTFSRSANDLVITRNSTTTDNVRVGNWFAATNQQLDFVQFTDQTLTAAQINSLLGFSGLAAPMDETDVALTRFVDAMNHFDAGDNLSVWDVEARNSSTLPLDVLAGGGRSSHSWHERAVTSVES